MSPGDGPKLLRPRDAGEADEVLQRILVGAPRGGVAEVGEPSLPTGRPPALGTRSAGRPADGAGAGGWLSAGTGVMAGLERGFQRVEYGGSFLLIMKPLSRGNPALLIFSQGCVKVGYRDHFVTVADRLAGVITADG